MSPVKTDRDPPSSMKYATAPSVCPGMCIALAVTLPTETVSPVSTKRDCPGTRPRSEAYATTSVIPHAEATASLPPTWSWWWCVLQMETSFTPSRLAAASTGSASEASTTAASPVRSHTTR